MPTSSPAVLLVCARVSSSITLALPVANSWPFTNTLPNAVIAPDDTELMVAVPEGVAADPPPPHAASESTASAQADGSK